MQKIFDHELQKEYLKKIYQKANHDLNLSGLEILKDLCFRSITKPKNILIYGYCDNSLTSIHHESIIHCGNIIQELNTVPHHNNYCYIEEESIFKHPYFDLAFSNMSLQFANNFPKAIANYKRLLKNDGLFIAVFPGENSLQELRKAFSYADQKKYNGVFSRIMPMIRLNTSLEMIKAAGFKGPVAHLEKITFSYDNILELLKNLRNMGYSNFLYEGKKSPITKEWINCLQEYYYDYAKNGNVDLNFELVVISGFA